MNKSDNIYNNLHSPMREMGDNESDYSNYTDNKLDIAFIAEDSREVRSVSICSWESDSISGVFQVNSSNNPNSPFLNFEPEISNMDEWPVDDLNIFGGKMVKRSSSKSEAIVEEIEESNEEEREIEKMSKCTKKRIGEKMKVITVG